MKWYCTVCGYVHEGDQPPEQCPVCKQPASKFKKMEEEAEYATVHKLGEGKMHDTPEEIIQELRANFEGECSEVGMYLAMARVADREGYPEVAEAFKRYAFEEADHGAQTPRQALAKASSRSQSRQRRSALTLSTTPFTKWQRTRQDTAQALRDF